MCGFGFNIGDSFCAQCGQDLNRQLQSGTACLIDDFKATDATTRQEAAYRIISETHHAANRDATDDIKGEMPDSDRIEYPVPSGPLSFEVNSAWHLEHIFSFDFTGAPKFKDKCNDCILQQLQQQQANRMFPAQIAIAVKNSHINMRLGDNTVYWCKYCRCAAPQCPCTFRVFCRVHLSSLDEPQCSTTVCIEFDKPDCYHERHQLYGQTRGLVRQTLAHSGQKPHLIQNNALGRLADDILSTGNRQNVPGPNAAGHISSERRTQGRKHTNLLQSLVALASTSTLDETRPQVKLDGGLFDLRLDPPSGIITNECNCYLPLFCHMLFPSISPMYPMYFDRCVYICLSHTVSLFSFVSVHIHVCVTVSVLLSVY